MTISDLKDAIYYFPKDAKVSTDYVPATFPLSSAPCNPSLTYICVELCELLAEEDEKSLKEMGWCCECDGLTWLYYF